MERKSTELFQQVRQRSRGYCIYWTYIYIYISMYTYREYIYIYTTIIYNYILWIFHNILYTIIPIDGNFYRLSWTGLENEIVKLEGFLVQEDLSVLTITVYPMTDPCMLYMVTFNYHQYIPFMLAYIYQHHGSYGYPSTLLPTDWIWDPTAPLPSVPLDAYTVGLQYYTRGR